MRRSDRCIACVVALAHASACVVKLDHEFDAPPASDAGAVLDAAVASGCRVPFANASSVRSIATANGVLFIDDHGSGYRVASPSADCAWSATPLGTVIGPSPILAAATAAPLDLVATDAGPALYYALYVPDASAAFGVRAVGYGVALEDTSGHFAPSSELLWSGDRAPYGGSAMRVGDRVYVYGCVPGGFLESDCYLARAPVADIASSSAYEYFNGVEWSPNPDDAKRVASGGSTVSVRAEGDHFVMTYVPPLGSAIAYRTAMAPEGPWSGSTTIATCDLTNAGDGAFCSGAAQQAIDVAPGQVALTYTTTSFSAAPGADRPLRLVVLGTP
jgi:hypothetical protein